MSITGTGAVEREQSILFVQLNGVWEPIGEDNESLERTRNEHDPAGISAAEHG